MKLAPSRWNVLVARALFSSCFAWLSLIAILFTLGRLNAAEHEKTILAHYMPWYASRDVSGQWGWHWAMNHFDPDRVLWEGKREAASHDYPLIGLYDSSDDHAIECQTLLMKIAGLDGVVVDWYGTSDLHDFDFIHNNTQKLVKWLKKVGLRFAICYEDKALASLPDDDARKQASLDMQWLEEHWLHDDAYVKDSGHPILFVFGPQRLAKETWNELRTELKSSAILLGLPHLADKHEFDGCFAWPPVADGKSVSQKSWHRQLDAMYSKNGKLCAVAFPGYKDIYKQAGVRDSYGSIDTRVGNTFSESLKLAFQSRSKIIQLATWNDYGEGTVIEPTRNHGYRYLEELQRNTRDGKTRSVADLRLPVMLYQLRKRSVGDKELIEYLDRASELLLVSKYFEAEAILASVSVKLGRLPARFSDFPNVADENYRLTTEILYREADKASDAMHQRCRLDVYTPVKKRSFDTIVWFHGGGLTAGERSIPMPLRNQGVAVVAVNYRLSPNVESPAFLEDAAAAVAWTMKHIEQYGGSPDRVFVSGHSAGAYLSTMIGLDKRWLSVHAIDANAIAGVIPFSSQMITHFAIREETGIGEKQPIVDEFAPLYHVRKDAPPMLILTGDREKELMGRYEENAYFWRMMKLVGHSDVKLHELDGYDHGKMPEPAFPLLLRFVKELPSKKN